MIDILLNRHFVEQAINGLEMEKFIEEYFKGEIFSGINIERTPLGLRIVIKTSKPGRIIGAGGRKINDLSDLLKEKFKIENPQLDVKTIKNPDMDASIVAKQFALALETGNNAKRVGNLYVKKIMDAGALGVQIIVSGKMGGSKGTMQKFSTGYIKYCGDSAKKLVDYGFAEAETRPGKIGIQVKIMKYFMDTFGNIMTKKEFQEKIARDIGEKISVEDDEDFVAEENVKKEKKTGEKKKAKKDEKSSDEKAKKKPAKKDKEEKEKPEKTEGSVEEPGKK